MEEELRRHPTALSLAGHSKELQVTEQTSQALPVHTLGLVRPGRFVLQAHRGWRCRRKLQGRHKPLCALKPVLELQLSLCSASSVQPTPRRHPTWCKVRERGTNTSPELV